MLCVAGAKGPMIFEEDEEYIRKLTPGTVRKVATVCSLCGRKRTVRYSDVLKAQRTMCQSCVNVWNRTLPMIGKTYGRLLVLEFLGLKKVGGGKGSSELRCRCSCGTEVILDPGRILSGHTTSCGCAKRELVGPLHPAYRHDVTPEERQSNHWQRFSPQYGAWRLAVFERDKFTCQCCGKRGKKLTAHHLNNFAEHPVERFDVDNGVTLCKKCHKAFHVAFMGGYRKKCTKNDFALFIADRANNKEKK